MPLKDPEKRRIYHREYIRRWYAANKAKHKNWVWQRSAKYKQEIQAWIAAYKSKLSCERCQESHPACLDFHHRDPALKIFGIGNAVSQLISRKRIQEEIAKCIVLCANCHRKLHYDLRRL